MATLEQIEKALRAADAAGNVEDARMLAQAYAEMRGQQGPKADFSGVQGSASTKATAPPVTIGGQSTEQMPGWKRAAFGVASAVANPIIGVGQMTGLMDDNTAQESVARVQAIRGTPEGFAGGLGGDVALMAAPLSRVGALSKGGQYAASAGAGAGFAGLQPVMEGEDRGTNVLLGGALGAAGQKGANALNALGQRAAQAITPEMRALYEAAKARGIQLTPSQISDSKGLKFLQSQLSRLPLAGAGRGAEQRAAFNRQIAKEIGEDADAVTPEVYARAKARHSAQFEDLTQRNNLKVDQGLMRKLADIEAEARLVGGDALSGVRAAIEDLMGRSQTSAAGAIIPGRSYQAFDSQLGGITKLGTPASHFVGKVRSAVRSAMDDSISPADKEAWQQLRREYGNRKTIRDLVAKGDGGELSPAQLMGRVTANNYGKESMASGTRGGLGELARIGQRLKEPPTSGTAERMASMATGAGAVVNLPLTLGALLGGRAAQRGVDSGILARFLMRRGRGQGAQFLSPYVRGGLPGIGVPLQQGLDDPSEGY